jgi:hypothetical protein
MTTGPEQDAERRRLIPPEQLTTAETFESVAADAGLAVAGPSAAIAMMTTNDNRSAPARRHGTPDVVTTSLLELDHHQSRRDRATVVKNTGNPHQNRIRCGIATPTGRA